MEPGLMRHRIDIQERADNHNEFGESDKESWRTVASVRASVSPVSGREFLSTMQEHSEITHKVTIRYNPVAKPHMRIVFRNRVFDILHIIDQWEMHREMTLMCKELVS